ncbi:MAG TPA: hypothetical protein DIW31_03025 [Bacteroidales bacterium]|nr:hypothetical protein [Bacteroidales bacterium]
MKNILSIISLVFVVSYLSANPVEFPSKQKAIIYNDAIKVLKNYEQYSNQMADAVVNIDELNKLSQKLIDQFVSRKAIIFNDLDPTHKLSEAYELESYVANILLWYPDGMKISLDFDNLKAGNIISHGDDIYTVDIMTSKRINGNYLNKQQNKNTEELLFRIAFFQKNGSFENYKIAGVRSSKSTTLANDSKLLAEVKSVEFTDKEMQQVKEQTRAILNDYINFLNLLTDPKENSEDKGYYRISFLGLFKDSTMNVANDIEPNPQKRWLPITDYQKNIVASYPEGIRNLGLNIDSAEYGKVVSDGGDKYYINGYIDKFFSGKYQSKSVFRDNSKYDFKVSFERDDNTFKNFKLSSIDKFGVNLYNQTSNNSAQELPSNPITSINRKGLHLGLSLGGGFTYFNDKNLTSNSILEWGVKGKTALNAEASASWYFTNRLGVNIGIEYCRYGANANLSGTFRNNKLSIDTQDEPYLKIVAAAYDSLLNLNYISIPISFIFHSNSNPEKWGFYFEGGVVASFNLGSTYKTTGSFATSGFYEQFPENTQIISIPEWGFINRANISNSGKANVSNFNLALKSSVGITYPINYFTTIFVGPEIIWNISNLSKAKNSTNAFGEISPSQKVGLLKYGVKFGVSYKF